MEPEPESILREINQRVWTIGYTGQSPERLKAHMRNMNVFDVKTLRAKGGIDKETGYELDGDYFGLPWPCYGTPEMKHPGSPNLYDTTKHVMDGGGNFRANFGVERDGVNLLAEDGSHSKGADITTGYPEFDHVLLKKLGWWDELTDAEKKAAEGKNWKTDLSGGIIRVAMKNHGCHPFGNAKARAVVWNFPDPIPQHREPLYSTRPDLVAKYPTHDDKKAFWRLPTLYKTVQEKNKDIGKTVPADHDLGPAGRVRRRRRGDALQPVAGRAAAGDVRRDQPGGGQRPRHPQRRARLGASRRPARKILRARRWSPSASTPTRCSCRSTSRAAGRASTCCRTTRRARSGGARRGGQHRHDLRLRQRDDDAGDQDDGLPGRASDGIRETITWHE